MASTQGSTLLDKIWRDRGVSVAPDIAEFLVEVSMFLQAHETRSLNEYTHLVFDNFQDWWMGPKSSDKLVVVHEDMVRRLHSYIARCYDLGIPLTIKEKCTPHIHLAQDIEVSSTRDDVLRIEEIIDPNSSFTRHLGRTMAQLYPALEALDVWAFDATGVSRTTGMKKTSIRLVWPEVVVDRERAVRIRESMVYKFKRAEDEDIELQELQRRMKEMSQANEWSHVFDDSIYQKQSGIRMPLCDRTSPRPLQRPEGRPFKPFCGLRFALAAGNVTAVQDLSSESACFESVDWVTVGSVREDGGKPLTAWSEPVWHGHRSAPSGGSAPRSAADARNPGGVPRNAVRTEGGSVSTIRRGSTRNTFARTSSEASSSQVVRNDHQEFRGNTQGVAPPYHGFAPSAIYAPTPSVSGRAT